MIHSSGGVDFHEIFAPMAKLVIVRCALAVASKMNWEVHQLDVNNVFLHGDLEDNVYLQKKVIIVCAN